MLGRVCETQIGPSLPKTRKATPKAAATMVP